MILSFFSDMGTFFSENPLYLVAILVVLLIVIIAAFAISGLKKKKKATPTEAQKEPVKEKKTEKTSVEETAVSTETQEEPVKEEKTEESSVEKKKSSTAKGKDDSSQTTAEEKIAPTQEESSEHDNSVAEKLEKNYAEENIYHVTKRKEDGKWQVKLQKGGKAIKLFNTQEEAYAYAKKLAGGKDGTVHLHKVSGQIRKYK